MSEEFRTVAGYEGLYEVSDLGRVRRVGSPDSLRPQKIGLYYGVNLSKNGIHQIHKIHRLMALAFLENPLNKPCVDHRDRNKLNNVLSNLRWATRQENGWNFAGGATSSGLKGVYLHSCGKYVARISTPDSKQLHLGLYATKEEAFEAYKQAADHYHGEFACY